LLTYIKEITLASRNPGFTDEAQMDRLVHPKMKILENN